MTGILNALIAGVSGAVKDTYFNLVSLLLPGNGTNGATNNSFVDSSTANSGTGWPITRNGDTTQGTFSPFSQTGWGAYFDGASDYLQYTNSDFSVSTGDFTAEWWMYVTSDKSQVGIMTASSNSNLTIGYGGGSANARRPYVEWGGAGSFIGTMSNYMNSWVHICIMRSSGTVYTFQNGALLDSLSKTAAVGATTNMVIGTNSGDIAAQSFPGYLSNVRFSKAAIYSTSGFTPSTTPLTRTSQGATNVQFLTLQSNRLLDSNGVNTPATSPLAITRNGDVSVTPFSPFAPTSSYSAAAVGGSGYFDGSGDSLTLASNAALTLSGDLTVQFWVYLTTVSGSQTVWSSSAGGQTIQINAGNWVFYDGTATQTIGTAVANMWQHIAFSRTGTTLEIYLDGVRGVSYSYSTTLDFSGTSIGYRSISPAGFNITGYLSGFRLIKGTGIYTGTTMTVPTAPLTNITNTSLLLNFTNAGVVDATAKNVLETEGNAQISTAQSKWGGGSMYFDGNGDYLLLPNNSLFGFRTAPFTIEFWFYPTASLTNGGIIDMRSGAASSTGLLIRQGDGSSSGTTIQCFLGNTASTTPASQTGLSINAWNYIAVVRDSSNDLRVYINGSAGSAVSRSIDLTDTNCLIGAFNGATSSPNATNGYIDDLRITRGVARTVTTSPSGPFPLQ
jgi:hypothetical protein